MNATAAVGYAFNFDNTQVTSGEFVFASELPGILERYDGYIENTRFHDLKSGHVYDLRGVRYAAIEERGDKPPVFHSCNSVPQYR